MSIVSYNGKAIIPGPFCSIQKTYQRDGANNKIGKVYTITLSSKMLAFMGAPLTTGNYTSTGYPTDEVIADNERLGAILRKREWMEEIFSDDGKILQIQAASGSPPLRANCKIISLQFPEELWFQYFDYTVTLETNIIYVNGTEVDSDNFTDYVDSVDEQWSLESSEPENENIAKTYILTHTVSAKGQTVFDINGNLPLAAWQRAQLYILPKLGMDNNILMSSGVNNLPSYYGGYNHVRSENIDKNNGGYSVTETWIIASGTATEDFTVSMTTEQGSALKQASIQGEIRGLDTRDSNMNLLGSKHYHADVKWGTVQGQLLNRVQTYTGISFNPTPLSTNVGVNPVAGVITYSYEYNNRPSHIVSDTKMENITVTHSPNTDIFGAIFILGRGSPILQNLGAKQAKTVSVNIDLIMNSPQDTGDKSLNTLKNYFTYSKPSILQPYADQIAGVLSANNPLNYGFSKAFVSQNSESWNPATASYSLSYEWTYE